MEGTYDTLHDSMYLYLTPKSSQRVVARTIESSDNRNIFYDHDIEGKIIGIEFLNASSQLPNSVLEKLARTQ